MNVSPISPITVARTAPMTELAPPASPPQQPYVAPGTYFSPVTKYHPAPPAIPVPCRATITVHDDQSRSYGFVKTAGWVGPGFNFPDYPAPIV